MNLSLSSFAQQNPIFSPGEKIFIRINMAMTADGKIATADRRVSSFGSARDKQLMQSYRGEADAVLVGARTALSNRVGLGPNPAAYHRRRIRRGLSPAHLKVIVTGTGNLDPRSAILQDRVAPILAITSKAISKRRLQKLRALVDEVLICGAKRVDLPRALEWLGSKWRVKHLLCEGGAELNGSLFEADLVDEICLTICPRIFGGESAPTIADGADGALNLADATRFKLAARKRVGDELFVRFKRFAKVRR